jgi:hypothetical protein
MHNFEQVICRIGLTLEAGVNATLGIPVALIQRVSENVPQPLGRYPLAEDAAPDATVAVVEIEFTDFTLQLTQAFEGPGVGDEF